MQQADDETLPFPRVKLSPEEAMAITIAFREIYHLGKAERVIPSEFIRRYKDEPNAEGKIYNVPPDIAKFRLEHYGEQLEKFPLVWGFMMLTWIVFPSRAVPTTWRILLHGGFEAYETLYFSVYSVGSDVYKTSPKALLAFFTDHDLHRNKDYYIFPADLTWCIAVTHDDDYIFVPAADSFNAPV